MKCTGCLLLFLALFPLGALAQGEKGEGTREILQSDGTVVTLGGIPERVVSLGPNITETIFALGKGDLLVGRTDYCNYPPEAASVPSVGRLTDPSLETILLLEPDLVIGSTHMKKETAEKISAMGIPVLNLYGEQNFDGVYRIISSTAQALDAEEEGRALVQEMKNRVRSVEERVKDLPRPRVYYVIGYGEYGDYTAGGNTFIGQLLTMAGAENVASGLEGWRYSLEELVSQNPDLLICSAYANAREGIMASPGYRELSSVRAGRVYPIDNNMLDRQGPRLAEGLAELAGIIHGNEFP